MIADYELKKHHLGCNACNFDNFCTGEIESLERNKRKIKARFKRELFDECGYAYKTLRYKPVDFFLKKRF